MSRHAQRHRPDPGYRCQPCRSGEHGLCITVLLARAAAARGADPGDPMCSCHCRRDPA